MGITCSRNGLSCQENFEQNLDCGSGVQEDCPFGNDVPLCLHGCIGCSEERGDLDLCGMPSVKCEFRA